ncbi:hypothetical protein AQ490_26885 [Wenjunlia vitaminophila]|uniref:SseB protein N-terminal domain-containing protein n=1 Tax=Wenjunlia vitaminophila TaxID=76728 RepID=A0A0T6LQ18_WENVI|nr:SseB family protein [Wenjunlia vitaminophila]KRV47970.1 hypothetical protein AQ490_26885 [Wenjunlia vitaminophila]
MTDSPTGDTPPSAQQALRALAENGADEEALFTLATSEVLLPDPGDPEGHEPPEGEQHIVSLPVFEQQDGARLVPVFTSEVRMAQALPQIERYHRVPLAVLAGSWPSDDLSLTIDAGAPEAVTLTAQGVRTLPGLGGG